MPLIRYISVRRVSGKDALSALIATSNVAREIADLLQCAPAKAAAGILLVIFETIQHVQTNRQDCHRLALRCLSLLVDVRDHMTGHEDSAPPSLLRAISKFEEVLKSIHEFMKHEAEQKWGARLMRKSTIENALSDYNAALDDAARAFQIATLINIHLAVGDAPSSSKKDGVSKLDLSITQRGLSESIGLPVYTARSADPITDVEDLTMSPVPSRSTTRASFDHLDGPSPGSSSNHYHRPEQEPSIDLINLSSPATTEFGLTPTSDLVEEEEVGISEHHGFNRYHQSQFRMKGKSRAIKDGWWAGAVEGDISGNKSLMLRYEGDRKKAMKRWVRDVKLLQNVYHPNLPQMVGYSNDETPTPFILLANVQTRLPQAMLLDALRNASLAQCAQLILRFYRDTLDAALYLQQQLDLSESKIQDYIESSTYRIDAEQTVVMGLPPPEIDSVVSWRNYGLAHSIRDVYLKILPNRGLPPKQPVEKDSDATVGMQLKVNHLTILARALLPNADNISTVHDRLHKLLGSLDDDEAAFDEPPVTLRQIRKAAIAANTHQQAWFANDDIIPHKFSVGDLGYIPKGRGSDEKNWGEFVLLRNVLEQGSVNLETKDVVEGSQGGWQYGVRKWDDLASFELPGGIFGWTVVVSPEADIRIHVVHTTEVTRIHDAWNYLLDSGKAIAEAHGINPEELILITRAGTEQRFRVRDLRKVQYWPASVGGPTHGGGMHSFQSHSHSQRSFPGQFGHQPFGGGSELGRLIPGQDLAPRVFYLLTSGDKSHEPYFSQTPVPKPLPNGEKPPQLDPSAFKCFALLDVAYGFLNYVQLHAEDFEE